MNKLRTLTFIVALVFLFQMEATTQNHDEVQTLFNKKDLHKEIGFSVTPGFALTEMDGATASLFHIRGGINFSDKITLGGFYNTSLNEIHPKSETLPEIYMDYWSLGGFLEYTIFSRKLIHATFPILIGGGEVEMDDEWGDNGLGESNFFLVEPIALLELNLHKYVRFNIGAGYRFIGEMNYRNFNHQDISGPTGYIGLKFGLFR
ncbi:MAG TPA: hypothetical protein VLH16_00710 [Bacteroidales bacterium]|nr:hypothetical protein [Bacteroidales bacterium]